MITPKPIEGRPVIFGEVLYDRFPDGAAVLGGAPFNVAWHLQGFGCEPLFVSRVGDDEAGRRVQHSMQEWNMDTVGVQVDPQSPTGAVEISFSGSQHSFDILPAQAYDHIDTNVTWQDIRHIGASLIYHGSLIIRTDKTRQGLNNLVDKLQLPVFVDINLREPWWRAEDWPVLFNRARWVKVNDDELDLIVDRLDMKGNDLEDNAQKLQAAYQLDLLIVTRGAQGALAFHRSGERVAVEPEQNSEIVDTVGAGDALSSVVLLGLLRGWPLQVTLQRAQGFASRICGQRGATSREVQMYQTFLKTWGEAQ